MVDTGDVRGTHQDLFERLYAEHAQALFGFLRYRTGDQALAEDLLADTYERVLRAHRRFDPRKASEKTWLYAIALNCLSDNVRRRTSESRALELIATGPDPGSGIGGQWGVDETDPLDEIADRDLDESARDLLSRSLALLEGSERESIALRFGAEMTIAEIAEVTGERPATIERRVYRALSRLRETWG
jgi:RNA polymerase sigma-70 factor (ECF subfamily)